MPLTADRDGGATCVAICNALDDRYCEGFRMTALTRACLRHLGRRRKASSEGTRGDVVGPVPQGLWRLIADRCGWTRLMAASCSALS